MVGDFLVLYLPGMKRKQDAETVKDIYLNQQQTQFCMTATVQQPDYIDPGAFLLFTIFVSHYTTLLISWDRITKAIGLF